MSGVSDNKSVYHYEAARANGTEEQGSFTWPRQTSSPGESGRRAESVVKDLMRRRFNQARVHLDGREVGKVTQAKPGGRRSMWWETDDDAR